MENDIYIDIPKWYDCMEKGSKWYDCLENYIYTDIPKWYDCMEKVFNDMTSRLYGKGS